MVFQPIHAVEVKPNFAYCFSKEANCPTNSTHLGLISVIILGADHYLVVAKVRERLAVRKQAAQKFDGGRYNLRKLNDLEVRKQYQIEITNRFAALENVSEDKDINRGWESIKENI
jgi:hypothetical protein